jgi:hypothetical protein
MVYNKNEKVTVCLYVMNVGFEVLTTVVLKSPIFWHITLCNPLRSTNV